MSEYQIGSTLQQKDKTWRIVRVVTHDTTLFEDEQGAYLITESYLQLKAEDGSIDHIVLESDKLKYDGAPCRIKGLDPISWRTNG